MSAYIESFQYLHSLFKHANLLHQRNQHTGTQIINAVLRSRKRRGGKRQGHHLRKGHLLDSIVLRHRLCAQIIIYIYTEYNMRVAHLPSMKIPSLQSSKTAPHAPPPPLAYALTSHLKVQNPAHAMNARGCINQVILQTFEPRKVFTCRFAADSRRSHGALVMEESWITWEVLLKIVLPFWAWDALLGTTINSSR